MAGRPCICPICKQIVNKKEAFQYKNKYYHDECFNSLSKQTTKFEKSKQKQKIEQAKIEIKQETHIIESNLTDEDILAKEKVINYIKQLLEVKKLNVKIYKLLKDFYNTYNFSYEGMFTALEYFYEVMSNPVVQDCVGIIPYIYDDAQKYKQDKIELTKQVSNISIDHVVTQKVVQIKKPVLDIQSKLIDVNGLE